MSKKLLLKQVLITLVLSLMFFNLSAQTEKKFLFKGQEYTVKSDVLAYLGVEKAEEYSSKAPLKLMYFNFYSSNSYLVINELPNKNGVTATAIKSTLGQPFVVNESDFDIFKTDIKPSDKNQYFKFNNKYMMVYPQGAIDRSFDSYIESIQK